MISQQLINHTDEPQTVTYIVTPESGTTCDDGPSDTVTVIINPTPRIVPLPEELTQCDSTYTNIVLESPSVFTNGTVSFRYEAEASGNAGDVTGFVATDNDLADGYVISQRLINHTDEPQTVTYIVTPESGATCNDGPSDTVVVIINPTPRIFPVPLDRDQCDSTLTDILLISPSLFTDGQVSFRYEALASGSEGDITGFTSFDSGLGNGYNISQRLINHTDVPQTVTYVVTPVSGVSCNDGPSKAIVVTVDPTPRAVPVNVKPDICYDESTEIVLASPSQMTTGDIVFDYSISKTGTPGYITGNELSATGIAEGEVLEFGYRNDYDNLLSVKFNIIPRGLNSVCNPGPATEVEVKVHPLPAREIIITHPYTCKTDPSERGAMMAIVAGGVDPLKIIWNGPVGYHVEDEVEITSLDWGRYDLKVADNAGCTNEISEYLSRNVPNTRIFATPLIPDVHISCPGASNGTIDIYVPSGSTAPYDFRLVKNDTITIDSGTFTGNYDPMDPGTFRHYDKMLGAGMYTLIITDNNLCEVIKTVELKEPEPIVAEYELSDYNGYSVSCRNYNNGFIRIKSVSGGGGAYQYEWNSESGPVQADPSGTLLESAGAGEYYVTISDLILDCSVTDTVTLTEPEGMNLENPVLSLSEDGDYNISCFGGDEGSISLTITGGSDMYTYQWEGPGGFTSDSEDIAGLVAGTYTVTVMDLNGCTLMLPETHEKPEFVITEPDVLDFTYLLPQSDDGAYNINCAEGTGDVGISVTGGSTGNYTYTWTTEDGSGIIEGVEDQPGLGAGTYTLRVTDLNGCEAEKTFTLTSPLPLQLQLTPSHITCNSPGFDDGSVDLSVSGGIAPYTYLWSNGAVTEDISGLTQDTYTITVTDANGCEAIASVAVTDPPPLSFDADVSDYHGFNISCYGMSDGYIDITLTNGKPPYSFTWLLPDGSERTTNSLSGLKAGQYALHIEDINTCTFDTVFTLTEPGRIDMDVRLSQSFAGGYNINCDGWNTGSIFLEAVNNAGPVQYLWADGEIGSSRTGLQAGNYRVVMTDANNCRTDSTFTLTDPPAIHILMVTIMPTCREMSDGQIIAQVNGGVPGTGYSYLWSDQTTGRSLSNVPAGKYTVTVTDANYCIVSQSIDLKPENELCLVIPNAISPNGDGINEIWELDMSELYPLLEVKIFDRWGSLIWKSEKGYPRPWDGTSDGKVVPMDSYHYIIDLNNGTRPMIGTITVIR